MQQRHIIRNQVMEVTVHREQDAHALRQQMGKTFQTHVLPRLDDLFSELVAEDQHIRINQLEIDLGEIDPINQEFLFSEKFIAELREAIRQKLTNANLVKLGKANDIGNGDEIVWVASKATHVFQQCFYFLETGLLPWWAGKEQQDFFEKLLEKISEDPQTFLQQIQLLFEKEPRLAKRYVKQFPRAFREKVWSRVLPDIHQKIKKINTWALELISRKQLATLQESLTLNCFTQAAIAVADFIEQIIFIDENKSKAPGSKKPTEVASFKQLDSQLQAEIQSIIAKRKTETTVDEGTSRKLTKKELAEAEQARRKDKVPSGDEPSIQNSTQKEATDNPEKDQGKRSKDTEEIHLDQKKANEDVKSDDEQNRKQPKDTEEENHPFSKTSRKKNLDQKPIRGKAKDRTEEKESNPAGKKAKRLEEQRQAARIKKAFEEGVQIQNAGLVLLTPFLHQFFKNLGLVENKAFKDEKCRERAVLLTQYLVNPATEIPEFDLALNKLICGLPHENPIDSTLTLTENEQKEVDELLEYVIANWKALKNTSAELLRSAFLAREGRLILDGGNWTLQIDQQTHDILLSKIPWGFSLVKLPWMDDFLYVEWSY